MAWATPDNRMLYKSNKISVRKVNGASNLRSLTFV